MSRQIPLRPGLCQRHLRQRQAGQIPRHPADERGQPDRRGAHAAPALYVNFRSFRRRLRKPAAMHRGNRRHGQAAGQGMHGSFSRAETRNFMAAIGPDFKSGFADPAPVSNADIAPTMAHDGAGSAGQGNPDWPRHQRGAGGRRARRRSSAAWSASDPGPDGVRTFLDEQAVGDTRYFDAAGFEGKTVGLTQRWGN